MLTGRMTTVSSRLFPEKRNASGGDRRAERETSVEPQRGEGEYQDEEQKWYASRATIHGSDRPRTVKLHVDQAATNGDYQLRELRDAKAPFGVIGSPPQRQAADARHEANGRQGVAEVGKHAHQYSGQPGWELFGGHPSRSLC